MNFFFDYIYYRLTKFYFKWDGKGSSTAILGVSMIQTLIIGDVVTIFLKFFYDRSHTAQYAKLFSLIGGATFILLSILNEFKYEGKYNMYRKQWKNEEIHKYKKKGLFVILALAIPWVVLILIGVYW